ncbi:MAG: phosphoribosyl-ATP diphosphatase [Planctomycetota bacterium]
MPEADRTAPGGIDAAARPLDALEATIRERAASPSEKSYTSRLLEGELQVLAGKVIEEASELVEAADEPEDFGRQHFLYEAGDLLYHVMVLLRWRGVDLAEVEAELARRFGVSGLDEKASRKQAEGGDD